MKKTVLIALVSVAAIGAQAGIITVVGTSPSGNPDILTGFESSDTAVQAVKYTNDDTGKGLAGQSFQLGALGAGDDYKLTDLYLKSGTNKDFDAVAGNLSIKIFSGTSGPALGTYSFDVSAAGDGSSATDAATDSWVKLSLDTGLVLDDGGTYSFLVFWEAPGAGNNWNMRRDNDATDGYTLGGGYYAGTTYDGTAWTSNPWNNVSARSVNQDQMFQLGGSVIPEPATLGLVAMVGGALLGIRKRFGS